MFFGSQPDFFLITSSLIYFITAGIFSWILIWSRNIRRNPALLPFRILLILFIVWSVDYALYSFTFSLDQWILLEQVAYICYTLIPAFLFVVTWQYTGHPEIIRFRWSPLIFVIPAITILIAWAPNLQGLLMYDFFIDTSGLIPVLEYQYGVWAYAYILSTVVLTFGSMVLLVKSLYTHPHHHRKGILSLIYAICIFSIWNMLFLSGLIPLWLFCLPWPLLLIAILLAISIFQYNILDFLPMGRNIVLEQITDLFLILSLDDYVLDMNPSMAREFGIDLSSSLGLHLSEVFGRWPDLIGKNTESNEEIEFFSHRKDDETRIYSIRKSVITEKKGQVLGKVLFLHDISDLASARTMLAESNEELKRSNILLSSEIQERKKAEAALRQSEGSLRTILDSMHDAVFILDREGNILDVNARMLELFHLADGEEAKKFSPLDDYSDRNNQFDDINMYWMQVLSGNGAFFEWKARRPGDGSLFDSEIFLTRINLSSGPAILISVRDITERKRVERALSVANEKLNLLSTITRHDILNSVTALKGFLKLSLEENPDETVCSYLEQCQELTEMIESQIRFTSIYDDIGIYAPTWQYLPDIIGKVRADLPEGVLQYHISLDNVVINADPLFEKVIFTLLDNTIRHARTATDVWFSSGQEGNRLVIIYEDNGTGIEYDDKEKIFQRGVGKNTGLGLFVSRDILAITGITISETGVPGEGARFEILIPAGFWMRKS